MVTPFQNLVCIDGGRALYYLHSTYYGIPVAEFDTLPGPTKQIWIDRAHEAIQIAGAPRPTMREEYLAGFNSAKVVGMITPEQPWGDAA